MQEQYLFRGKRIDNGEWVRGYFFEDEFVNEYDEKEINNYILRFLASYDTKEKELTTEAYIVDPSTVGQCTGLRDKNGTLIFNGDVVRCVSGESCQGFHEHDNTFKVDTADWQHMMELSECEEVFVACTTHTTPELMEGNE